MRRHGVRLAGLALATAAAAWLLALAPATGQLPDGTEGRIAGMSFYTGTVQPVTPAIAADASRIRGLGLNTVMFDTWWYLPTGGNTLRQKPGLTANDVDLKLAIRQARKAGLRVVLMPKFAVGPDRAWRGHYVPGDPATFWASYASMIAHYAEIAQKGGAWLLFVGSEMTDLETAEPEWRSVIATARQHFTGAIAYNTNQDARDSPVKFWDAVDYASSSGYFNLTGHLHPSVGELKSAWQHAALPKLNRLAAQSRKPVLIGEVGYLASSDAAKAPYDDRHIDYSPVTQVNCYQAFLEVMSSQRWFAGAIWWSWNGNPYRTPKGKPAEQFLKGWYGDGWRNGDGPRPGDNDKSPLPVPLPAVL
jgi:hypothetical protein